MFVLGTAGHIDHGKSALVQALTGMDPDRLREEKERGMTLDLGFAWLKLPSGREVGIVDVPGHERFIKNMLAGVGGIDLALLVIAANEGVMPQTREHLAILDLLEIRRGIVAVTKKDLVDEEWLTLVKMDIEELLKSTALAGAPVITVSAVTRDGLDVLVAAIDNMLNNTAPKKDIGRPRLPIDRVFSITGAGTIVTGTLIDGSLSAGQNIEIAPSGVKSRIRGLQTHKAQIATAAPGSRVAVNLVGVTTGEVQRGEVVTAPGWLTATTVLTASLHLLPQARSPLKHNAEVSFYTGAAESLAKVRLLEGNELKPGDSGLVQLSLLSPVATVNGDHFIIRSTTDTLGGGKVIEAHAKRLRRFRSEIIRSLRAREQGTAREAIIALLENQQPMEMPKLLAELGLPASDVLPEIDELVRQRQAVKIGAPEPQLLFTGPGWDRFVQKVSGILAEYHQKFPIRNGMLRVELASKLGLKAYAPAIISRLIADSAIIEEGLNVRLPAHRVKLTPAQQAAIDNFLKSLAQSLYAPPGDTLPAPELLNLLVERQQVVKVSEGIAFSTRAYDEMAGKIIAHIKTHGKITLGETRDMFGTSRKYAQALLEYLDEQKITRRVGDDRVLWKGN